MSPDADAGETFTDAARIALELRREGRLTYVDVLRMCEGVHGRAHDALVELVAGKVAVWANNGRVYPYETDPGPGVPIWRHP